MEDAVQTVMSQCELWADNTDIETPEEMNMGYSFNDEKNLKAAEDTAKFKN